MQAEHRLPSHRPAEELYTDLPEFEEGLNNLASQQFFASETHLQVEDTDYSGEQITVASLEIQPWLLAAAQPQSVYLSPVEVQTRTAGVIVLTVAVLVALAAVATARVLSNPVVQLRNVANQIASGDLQAQVPVGSRDETGQLAIAFNEMAKRLRETLGTIQHRASELATVARVSTEATQTTDTATLLQKVVDQTKSAFNLYHAHIYLLNEVGDTLVLTAGAGEIGKQMVTEKRVIPLDREQSLVARAPHRQGVIVNDVQADPGFLPHPLLPETQSEMAVPLIVGDNVLGVFDVQSDTVGRFSEEDISIQTTLASQVAAALQNTRQYVESIRFKLGIENTGDAVFATDVNGTITFANAAFEKVYGYTPPEVIGKNPRIIKSGLLNQEIYKQFWAGLLSKNPVSGEIVNKHKDGHFVHIAGTNSAIVNDAGEIIGFLAVHHDITEQKSNQELIAKRARQLASVAEISTISSQELDISKLLETVTNLTKERFNLYHSHVYLFNKAGDFLDLAAGAGEVGRQMLAEDWSIPLGHPSSIVARAARTKEPIVANDIVRDQKTHFLSNRLLPNTRSEMAVPLIVGDYILGVFDVQADVPGRFTEDDIQIQTTLAAQVSVAVQNARSFMQAKKQAERESTLNLINQKIQSATTVEAVLQIAARELGHALGAPMTIAQLGVKDKN